METEYFKVKYEDRWYLIKKSTGYSADLTNEFTLIDVDAFIIENKKLVDDLHRHVGVEGGVSAECGHPIQCLYAAAMVDNGPVCCSMCDFEEEVSRLKETKKEILIEVGALDTEVDNLYGWIGDRVVEYGKHKDIDKIMKRLSDAVTVHINIKNIKEVSPFLKELRADFRHQMIDAAYLENHYRIAKEELDHCKKEINFQQGKINIRDSHLRERCETVNKLEAEFQHSKCPCCGGEFTGEGYTATHVVWVCSKCGGELKIDKVIWNKIIHPTMAVKDESLNGEGKGD